MAKSNGFCHTFGGSPYGRPPQPPKVRVAIWAGFAVFYLVFRIRTRWRGAARLKVAGATACVDFGEIAKAQFKIQKAKFKIIPMF